MRVVFKPAGTFFLLTMIAVLCFFAFNNIEGLLGPRRAIAETPHPLEEKHYSTRTFRPLDITRMGSRDWTYYGVASAERIDVAQKVAHKTGTSHHIGPLEFIGHPPKSYDEDPRSFKWQDGDLFPTMTDARTGLTTDGIGNGFRFTVTPEIGHRHVLRVWVGGTKVRSKLMARLSDGSALSQMDESYTAVGEGEFRSVYTVVFTASKPDQNLIVSYLVADGGSDGSVSIQAVALE